MYVIVTPTLTVDAFDHGVTTGDIRIAECASISEPRSSTDMTAWRWV
jgi:hypothetical protein